jgi:hypothetical protein
VRGACRQSNNGKNTERVCSSHNKNDRDAHALRWAGLSRARRLGQP